MGSRNLLSLLILTLLLSAQSYATNYYVAPVAQYPAASDANTGTTLALPFATLTKALTKATVAGDTIFVRSGTYTVTTTMRITKTGTASKHIVLTAYKPDLINANSRPVFDFSSMVVSSSNIGIVMSGASYWDIFGIVIKGAGDNGMIIQSSSHHNKIEFCSFTRNRDTGLQIRSGSNHCLILNCDSYENADLGTGTTSLGGNADGFAPKLDVGDSIIFRGCRAWMNSDDGWDGYLKTSGSAYPDGMTTILEDCMAFHNGYYWLDGSTTSSENGNGFKMGGSDLKDEAHNFVVIRCLSFRNKAKGFDQNNNAGSMYLYNNTSHSNGDVDFGLNSSGVTYASGAVLVVINNVSLGSKGVSIRTGASVTNTTNSFVKSSTSTNFVSLDSTGATGMRNIDGSLPQLTYMRLQTSPASSYIDAGTILSSVTYHDGVGIPYNGTAPDLGAFETASISTVYTFTGNGNWDDPANWMNSKVPPASLSAGDQIIIDPVDQGECLLDISYTVSPGATLTVMTGKVLRVPGNLSITN